MTQASQISIAACVSENERAAVQLAAGHIARALNQADKVPWTCDSVFSPDLETLRPGGDAAIIITSFLTELGEIEEPWPRTEQRLRTAYAALCKRGTPVLICTILRHIDREKEPATAAALLLRIRRLNLLAAEISREAGAYVIDLDRVLADIGARRLMTDYRLGGEAAVDLAGHFIALTLLTNACDAFVSFEVQDAARVILTSCRPVIAETDRAKPEVTLPKQLLSMVHGGRKLTVSPVVGTLEENHVDWLIVRVLNGKVGPVDAFHRLVQSVRRHGIRESAGRLTSALSRQISRRK
jgi:hypothetical protein